MILNFRPASLFVYTDPPAPFPFQFSDDTGHGWPTTTVEPHLTDRDRSKLESAVSGGKASCRLPESVCLRSVVARRLRATTRWRRLWTASLASSIESPQMMGFTGGREGGRKTKIFRVRIRLIYGGRGRYTHRCPAKYRFFDIPDILDTPANIADRRWHSIAPNLSRLSYTSTDFFLN